MHRTRSLSRVIVGASWLEELKKSVGVRIELFWVAALVWFSRTVLVVACVVKRRVKQGGAKQADYEQD